MAAQLFDDDHDQGNARFIDDPRHFITDEKLSDHPKVLSQKLIDFLNEANFGPLYVNPDDMSPPSRIRDTLFFLNREIDGELNATYGIARNDIIDKLINMYIKGIDVRSDQLLNKYFAYEVKTSYAGGVFFPSRFIRSIHRNLEKMDQYNGDVNEFVNIFKTYNATNAQRDQAGEYYTQIEQIRRRGENGFGEYIEYIEIACHLVGGGCEDNLDPIYEANPLLYIRVLLDNLDQDLAESNKEERMIQQSQYPGSKTKFAKKH